MVGVEPVGQAIWDRFPPNQRLVINLTLTCNLACAHCNTESGPHRRERLTGEEVRAALQAGSRSGKRHVTFSGGEVFLFPAEMPKLIQFARDLGYVVDVETNAFWARTEQMAAARLAPFVEAGVAGMCLSADAYHVRYFPVDRTIFAARAGRASGLLVEVNFCPSDDPEVDAAIISALHAAGEPFIRNELIDRGRGREVAAIRPAYRVDELPECDSLTTTIHATGDAYACCEVESSSHAMKSTPVYLGSIRSSGQVPATERDARERLVSAFYERGSPIYFRRMVREHPMFQELAQQRYLSICDFCVRALGEPRRVEVLAEAMTKRSTP